MHPEDRVFIGVMNRKKDFLIAREQHWYRLPYGKAPRGIYAEYIAFFFSRAFGEQNGAIHYYARRSGEELATRAQLLPDEADHKRAQEKYHKLQFEELKAKIPPITNTRKRRLTFIYTTWDRFINAATVDDLYSIEDHLVDRIFYVLRDEGYRPQRRWQMESSYPPQSAQVRILCEDGEVLASTHSDEGVSIDADFDASIARIRKEIEARGGPRMISIPLE